MKLSLNNHNCPVHAIFQSQSNNDDYQFLGKIDLGNAGATKFLVVSPTASIEDIRGVASTACGSSRFCRLLIWDSKVDAETRFPLSEIAAEKQIATYIYNPNNKSEKLIVYDNFDKSIKVIYNSDPLKISYEEAIKQLNEIENSIDQSHSYTEPSYKNIIGDFQFESNFTKSEYMNSVNTVKDYIEEGDVMQVVLAQDFYRSFEGDSFKLYSALRQLNPSPYMYYLNLDECEVVGSSPEILVRVEDDDITLRPIAGTRKRGKDKKEDQSNENDLLNDPKELAEHLMLIDLGRNDVGRVSDIGSVKLTEKMVIEKYSHVMHIVSNVVGTLSKGLNFIDALKATLPAGTLSGAPKIRAMEIINELEPSSRGIYGGAIGYISWNGNIDTAIAIRTAVIKDKLIHVGAGAGIVADSDPESEWLECKQKAKVFLDAMEMIS